MLKIRKMEEGDLQGVASIEAENFSRPWTENSFRQAICDKNAMYLVALWEDIPVGYIGMWMALDEGEITNVSVRKEYRGRKAGRQLLEALLEEGTRKGVTSYFLEVRESNQAAIALYKKFGFCQVGIRKNFYEDPAEHGLVMCKR